MHKLTYLLVTLLSFLLAGCSSDDIIGRTDNPDTLSTAGYLRMSINMPAPHVSRAANDDFHNGLAAEYRINKAFLIILEGDTDDEMKAILHSAYEIDLHQSDASTDPSQITTTARIISRLDNGDSDFRSKKHFALLAINTGDMVSVSADHKKINFLGQDFDVATNKVTFGDFLKYTFNINDHSTPVLASAFSPKQGFLMFNAPLASKAGGTYAPSDECKVTYLTDISDAIYDTEREALSAKPTNIYVERAVAKVTMPENQQGKLTFKDVEIVDPTNPQTQDIPWKLVGWKLDCTNCVSHIIRNYSSSWNDLKTNSSTPPKPYRFIGDTPVAQGVSLFRTYWAEDPNYSDDGKDHREDMYYLGDNQWTFESAANHPVATDAIPYPMGFGDQWPQYCLENTFNVANQTQDQCTSIMAKLQIGDGQTDYYVVNDDKTHLYTREALEEKYHLDEKIREFYENDKIALDAYNEYDWAVDPFPPFKDVLTYSFGYCDNGSGEIYIKSVGYDFTKYPDAIMDWGTIGDYTYRNNKDNIALILGQDITIKKYENGAAYYPIRIKHFGDDLTPWKSNESSEVKPNDIYPGSDEVKASNYLGRYGVVRNNWYNVRINSVFGIGEPVIPTPPNTPDDELSNYINVSINVLSWTLRDQGADL